jgi:hypothetical protein
MIPIPIGGTCLRLGPRRGRLTGVLRMARAGRRGFEPSTRPFKCSPMYHVCAANSAGTLKPDLTYLPALHS